MNSILQVMQGLEQVFGKPRDKVLQDHPQLQDKLSQLAQKVLDSSRKLHTDVTEEFRALCSGK